MGKKEKEYKGLWDTVVIDDFENDDNIEEVDMGSYNLDKMKIFSANINYSRQLFKIGDGLKTVDKRILYTMYLLKAFMNSKSIKSASIVGETMKEFHPHGDGSIYKTMVGLSQYWKRAIPLIYGKGNFGNSTLPNGYAHMRYTEAKLSRYAKECFFDDFDIDCVDTLPNSLSDKPEPIVLPAKFPNILINGGIGIAIGNKFGIPPYNIDDIYFLFKRLMENPEHKNIYMIPELPTECDIVDNDRMLKQICETGEGVLRMRARIDIEDWGNVWVLRVKALPWYTSLAKIHEKIISLVKDGKIQVKDIRNASAPYKDENGEVKMRVDFKILINKALDPYAFRNTLFKNTELESSLSVQFKIVTEDLKTRKYGMRDLVLNWLDERREYKRRLFNKKIVKINAAITIRNILIELLSENNLEKTISIIKNSRKNEIVDNLVTQYGMTSFQASKIASMPLSTFNKESREEFINEREKYINDRDTCMKIVKSEKRIDEIILSELEDMRKYTKPKKCRVISTDNETLISDTDHVIITTSKNLIKKLPAIGHGNKHTTTYGLFAQGDHPTDRIVINNLDSIIMIDSLGKYSIIPVHSITNTEFHNVGNKIFDFTKLEGNIIFMAPFVTEHLEEQLEEMGQHINLITLSKGGYIKRTSLKEFNNNKTIKNARISKLKDDDEISYASLLFDSTNILIYTKNGEFAYLKVEDIPEMSKDSQGLNCIKLNSGDECIGCCAVGADSEYLVIVTEKGNMKKIELDYLGTTRKRKDSSYITRLSSGDCVLFCDSVREQSNITIMKKSGYEQYTVDNIPTLTRMAVPQKIVPVPVGDNIIKMIISY